MTENIRIRVIADTQKRLDESLHTEEIFNESKIWVPNELLADLMKEEV